MDDRTLSMCKDFYHWWISSAHVSQHRRAGGWSPDSVWMYNISKQCDITSSSFLKFIEETYCFSSAVCATKSGWIWLTTSGYLQSNNHICQLKQPVLSKFATKFPRNPTTHLNIIWDCGIMDSIRHPIGILMANLDM